MRPRRAVAEINVVPYIDVMLVLLVIFMATAPLLMQGVEVDLPKANSTPVSDSDAEPLIVSIDAEARLYLNLGASDDQALSIETVRQRVATVLKRNPDKAVMVWGDARWLRQSASQLRACLSFVVSSQLSSPFHMSFSKIAFNHSHGDTLFTPD